MDEQGNTQPNEPARRGWKSLATWITWLLLAGGFAALASCGTCLLRTH